VSSDGVITGNFSNGRTVPIAQIALATFQSNEGLTRIGGNLFLESSASGQPIIGQPSSGGRGKISSNSLEQSTVDLAQEFVNMITSQRGFQANSRTITTTDELLQELINLKR
jgi:flagellar hook protein FlgE